MSRAAGSGTTTTVRINLTARGVTLNGRAITGPTEDAFATALSLVSAQAANLPEGGFLPVSVTDERAGGYESTRTNVFAGSILTPSLFTRRSGNIPALPPSIMPRSRPAHTVSPAGLPPSIAPAASSQRRVPDPGHPPKAPSAPPAEEVPIFRSDKAPSATEKAPHKETDPTLSAEDLFGTTTADRRARRRHRSRTKGHRSPHAGSLGDLFTFSPPSSPDLDAVEAAEAFYADTSQEEESKIRGPGDLPEDLLPKRRRRPGTLQERLQGTGEPLAPDNRSLVLASRPTSLALAPTTDLPVAQLSEDERTRTGASQDLLRYIPRTPSFHATIPERTRHEKGAKRVFSLTSSRARRPWTSRRILTWAAGAVAAASVAALMIWPYVVTQEYKDLCVDTRTGHRAEQKQCETATGYYEHRYIKANKEDSPPDVGKPVEGSTTWPVGKVRMTTTDGDVVTKPGKASK